MMDILRPGGLALTTRAINFCSFKAGARVVDVGCGAGISVEYLRNVYKLDVIGIDRSEKILEYGRQRVPSLPLIRASGECLPFACEWFEGVLAECSLSVIKDTERVLTEFHRVLLPGGKLIVTDVYARSAEKSCLQGVMTQDQLIRKLREHGFVVKVWEDHSALWKEFICEVIMENGSLCALWQCIAEDNLDWQSFKQVRPGYYLMVAEKQVK